VSNFYKIRFGAVLRPLNPVDALARRTLVTLVRPQRILAQTALDSTNVIATKRLGISVGSSRIFTVVEQRTFCRTTERNGGGPCQGALFGLELRPPSGRCGPYAYLSLSGGSHPGSGVTNTCHALCSASETPVSSMSSALTPGRLPPLLSLPGLLVQKPPI